MAVSIDKFKDFARIRQRGVEGIPAVGYLLFTKEPAYNNSTFFLHTNYLVSTSQGNKFLLTQNLKLAQADQSTLVSARSQTLGVAGNISAGQTWLITRDGLVVTNPDPFTGGVDPIGKKKVASFADWYIPPDSRVQEALNLAIQNIKTKLGNPSDLPDAPGVDRSVYLLGQFFIEQWSFQERKYLFGKSGPITAEKTEYYRAKLFPSIQIEIDNLLAPYVDVDAFMPEVPV